MTTTLHGHRRTDSPVDPLLLAEEPERLDPVPWMLPTDDDPSLRAHLARLGRHRAPARPALIAELEAARLTGRGGAGFPLALKLSAMPPRGGDIVINACDGDPLTGKDSALLTRAPHLVIDGALVLGGAQRAQRTVIALHRGSDQRALRGALAERSDADAIELLEVEARYIASESSAIRSALGGGPGLPTDPGVRGTDRQHRRPPMLLVNAETAAQTALVARVGGRALAAASRGDEPGSALVTVTGAVARPQVMEARDTDQVWRLLRRAGARPRPEDLVLTGGVTGTWVRAASLEGVAWGRASLAAAGAERGTGALCIVPAHTCVLAETLEILRFADRAAARQCGPCAFGLPALADDLTALLRGRDTAGALARIERRSRVLRGRGGCSHPTAAIGTLASALAVTDPAHLAAHAAGSACGGTAGHLRTWIGGAR